MKLKLLLFISALALFINTNYAQAFEINKISEFGFSGNYYQYKDGLNIQDDYLYAVNTRSFQIFHIEDDHSLTLLSDVNLYHLTYSVVVKDNFAYVSTIIPDYVLYRFNIEDKYNPVLTDSLHLNMFSYTFINNNYVFVHNRDSVAPYNTFLTIYDNETFTEITQIDAPQNLVLLYIKENIAFNKLHGLVSLYDISNPDSLQVIAQYDVNDNWGYRCAKIIQDTILVIGNGAEIEFWDISEPFNWELIYQIELFQWNIDIYEDRMIVGGNDLRLYDISNLENPILLDYYNDVYPFYGGKPIIYNEIVYWGAGEYGIEIFSIAENTLNHIDNYCTYGVFGISYIQYNKLFVNSYLRGIHSFDISNLNEPQYIGEYLEEFHSIFLNGDGDIIVISGMTDIENEIWADIILNITEEGDLIPMDTIYVRALVPYYKEDIGFFLTYNDTLHKYIFDSDNQLEEVATLEIPGTYSGGSTCFYQYIAYIIFLDHLYVVKNIDTNELELTTTIVLENIICAHNIGTYEHYLFISESWDFGNCSIFDISDPETPEYLFNINKGGRIGIDEENHLLFLGGETCSIYDLTSIEYNYLYEIYSFQNWSSASSIIPFKRNNNNYIIYLENTSISIYEYSTMDVEDELQKVNDIQFSNYPNPFSTSTTISFSATGLRYATPRQAEFTKNTEIKIYNIKGQLVKNFELRSASWRTNSEFMKVVWDGKDENERPVSSGIYFYKIEAGKFSKIQKCLLLR